MGCFWCRELWIQHTVWVNRNNNIFDKLDFEPNQQISNLSELLDLI